MILCKIKVFKRVFYNAFLGGFDAKMGKILIKVDVNFSEENIFIKVNI